MKTRNQLVKEFRQLAKGQKFRVPFVGPFEFHGYVAWIEDKLPTFSELEIKIKSTFKRLDSNKKGWQELANCMNCEYVSDVFLEGSWSKKIEVFWVRKIKSWINDCKSFAKKNDLDPESFMDQIIDQNCNYTHC
jgi:hypothetical protein